jgi:hypothetical protein
VARISNVPISVAFHIVSCLLDCASRAKPRGSIGDFKAFDCAGIVDVDVEAVERVIEALRSIHWIEGNMLAEWDERQPTREDPDAYQRKREEREKKQDGHTQSHDVTHGHSQVTLTAAQDIDKKESSSSEQGAEAEKGLGEEKKREAKKGPLMVSPGLAANIRAKGWN